MQFVCLCMQSLCCGNGDLIMYVHIYYNDIFIIHLMMSGKPVFIWLWNEEIQYLWNEEIQYFVKWRNTVLMKWRNTVLMKWKNTVLMKWRNTVLCEMKKYSTYEMNNNKEWFCTRLLLHHLIYIYVAARWLWPCRRHKEYVHPKNTAI